MSIESDASNLRAPVALNPDLIGEERNVYSSNNKSSQSKPQRGDCMFCIGGNSDSRLLRRLLTLGLSTSSLR